MTRKIGRNDLCSCGSGCKYKKCCGAGKITVDSIQESKDCLKNLNRLLGPLQNVFRRCVYATRNAPEEEQTAIYDNMKMLALLVTGFDSNLHDDYTRRVCELERLKGVLDDFLKEKDLSARQCKYISTSITRGVIVPRDYMSSRYVARIEGTDTLLLEEDLEKASANDLRAYRQRVCSLHKMISSDALILGVLTSGIYYAATLCNEMNTPVEKFVLLKNHSTKEKSTSLLLKKGKFDKLCKTDVKSLLLMIKYTRLKCFLPSTIFLVDQEI